MRVQTTAQAAHPWLVPDWPAVPGVQALFTTRAGGVSAAPYDSLNLGDHVGDEPAAVAANRARLQAVLQAQTPGAAAVFLQQIHGCGVLHLAGPQAEASEEDTRAPIADACLSRTPGQVCTIMVADCLPVLWAHRSGRVVGAAHAGWRGLLGQDGVGVLESLYQDLCQEAQAASAPGAMDAGAEDQAQEWQDAQDWQVWLGPCIGPQAFEVGEEVRAGFCAADAGAAACFTPAGAAGKWLADLPTLARRRLQALGVTTIYGNDGSAPWCTVTQASRFFSHRRDAARLGSSGRMAACIWIG